MKNANGNNIKVVILFFVLQEDDEEEEEESGDIRILQGIS